MTNSAYFCPFCEKSGNQESAGSGSGAVWRGGFFFFFSDFSEIGLGSRGFCGSPCVSEGSSLGVSAAGRMSGFRGGPLALCYWCFASGWAFGAWWFLTQYPPPLRKMQCWSTL